MILQRTFSMIKPDAIKRNLIGKIISKIESNNLRIVALKSIRMTKQQAKFFYLEHKEKIFYNELINFMISEFVIVQILEGKNAIIKYREIMGNTNPKKAFLGTIRKEFALSINENSIHGSDSLNSAEREINFFFSKKDLINSY